MTDLRNELTALMSRVRRTDTITRADIPDAILAQYLVDALAALDKATVARAVWYGQRAAPTTTETTDTEACCGNYAECGRPCTPRGRWQRNQELAADMAELAHAFKDVGVP